MIPRIATVLTCLVWFACSPREDSSHESSQHEEIQSAHKQFRENPSEGTARAFLASLPSDFQQFDRTFGYDEGAAPLYNLPLHETLPQLREHLPAEEIAATFVALASGAEWDADNVNVLQHAYRELLRISPEVVVPLVMSLEANKRTTAIRFLFDGPRPSNKPFDPQVRIVLERTSVPFLRQADAIYEQLVAEEQGH